MLILHLSADFPDTIRGRTTPAIRNFLQEVKGLSHVVVSMLRKPDPRNLYFREDVSQAGARVFAYGYWGLPLGALHLPSLWQAARTIRKEMEERGIRPDAIHAHKLTFEGIIAFFLARWWGIPFVVSVRGEVETKIFRFKPLLRPFLRHVLGKARHVYFVSAWYRPYLTKLAPSIAEKSSLLPNFIAAPPEFTPSRAASAPHFVSIFDIGVYRKKGFHWLVPAFAKLAQVMPQARLDVIGWSNETTMNEVRALVEAQGIADKVSFLGVLNNADIQKKLPDYTALVLPSVNETFGMVYVEALFAGIPILYTSGTGIDGYLDGLEAGIDVSPGDMAGLEAALRRLTMEAGKYRAAISRDQDIIRRRFLPQEHVEAYVARMKSLA